MRIDAYDFGSITIDGKTYTRDLKIIDGRVIPDWWRLEGHLLQMADLHDVLDAAPEVLVVGTGSPGMMSVAPEVTRRLGGLGIKIITKPTGQACDEFNRLAAAHNTAFAAHLTC
jgi:hypothetical protein